MSHSQPNFYTDPIEEIKICTQLKYTGKLEIKSQNKQKWSFYYRFGRIIWATGGTHPHRRWRRLMTKYCPQINLDRIKLTAEQVALEYWDYKLLINIYKREEVEPRQVDAIAKNIVAELLFEVIQQANFSFIRCDRKPKVVLNVPINFISTKVFLTRMEREWEDWSDAGLASFSPNLSPMLREQELFKKEINPELYTNLAPLLNGQNTLQDLALKLNSDVLKVASDLIPFVLKELIILNKISDLPLPTEAKNKEKKKPSNSISSKKSKQPLIACIDDSLQICKTMEKIITSNDMDFLKIQDTIQALPILIQHKPDMIFLDLMMPVVNGYEVCSQIRRVSEFAKTPVIILTGSDGLFDRIRAKVVGSTDFITKPIVTDKVMAVIRKYLPKSIVKSNSTNKMQKL
ncbi:response regulator [Mastigocoleus testarum]|uniref:Protein PatA n=1 Tax=Mastigocoleus testarum BC008 TaxID=371196 RepID=A0A0V7ZPM4_9CYAN|nr:response regulator [Mastigocoleus testarum]KST66322.1 two-component system response regulator [Mastigocoleus testarum BC008]KST66643.1 two-component system response regulator [Mastigocoleus testarum BC008]